MSKNEYLAQLRKYLKHVSTEDKEDVISEYETHFISGQKDGKTEEDISKELGSPRQVARELNATLAIGHAEASHDTANIGKAIVAVMGLGLLNFFVVMVPVVIILGILFSLIMTDISLLSLPVFLAIKAIIPDLGEVIPLDIYVTLASFGVGLVLLVITIILIKWSTILFIKYLKWNIDIVKGSVKA
ncbi:DUF1700 domain-containing protein [Staphylococcus sp. SQ8-PEA]|uniref:DUF1700 domain-containing protein n=1 Tax=Staphylococcus marylandisciuri TaxID=2981529 RepID=A0ABT2QQP4_9STAP|nr:DUF1700 domain-containing protein [Staphylococcus marylandisciuri]MCU5746299.1 DUF1700 domain-containing protein [Staphylococcus marylandisciuri]